MTIRTMARSFNSLSARGPSRTRKVPQLEILLHEPEIIIPAWCWRSDWVQGGESIYSLLGIFQALNLVHGRHLREFIATPEDPEAPSFRKRSNIDLRSADRFRTAWFAATVHETLDAVRLGFVKEAFPVSGWSGEPDLRWCPMCARSGYHTAFFQLLIVHECPAHGCPLERRCPRCRTCFPYRLDASVATPLFCCPACKLDLAKDLRSGFPRSGGREEIGLITGRLRQLQYLDRLPSLISSALQGCSSYEVSSVCVGPPRSGGRDGEFQTFVSEVLSSLRPSGQLDWVVRAPSFRFVERIGIHGANAGRGRSAKSGWPYSAIAKTDQNLQQAGALYRCIRRHLWRTVVRSHHRCVMSACERLWWPIVGTTTSAFCPVAVAFLRWRLRWEAVPRLTDLLRSPINTPHGLVAWLGVAPFGLTSWTPGLRQWLIDHLLGHELLLSFGELYDEEVGRPFGETVKWAREWTRTVVRCSWVCAGRGSVSMPARLYFGGQGFRDLVAVPNGSGHRAAHVAALASTSH